MRFNHPQIPKHSKHFVFLEDAEGGRWHFLYKNKPYDIAALTNPTYCRLVDEAEQQFRERVSEIKRACRDKAVSAWQRVPYLVREWRQWGSANILRDKRGNRSWTR